MVGTELLSYFIPALLDVCSWLIRRRFVGGLSHGSSGRQSSFHGFSRSRPSYASVPPTAGSIRSSSNVNFSGAGITVPRRDGDRRSSAVVLGVGCPSSVGRGPGTSTSNGVGGFSPGVDGIEAFRETLVVFSSNGGDPGPRGKILATFASTTMVAPAPEVKFPAVPAPTFGTSLAPVVLSVTFVPVPTPPTKSYVALAFAEEAELLPSSRGCFAVQKPAAMVTHFPCRG